MSTQKENIWVILSGLGGLATVVYVLFTFWPPRSTSPSLSVDAAQGQPTSHSQAVETANTRTDTNDGKDGGGAESPGPEPEQAPAPKTPVLRPPRSERTASELPTEFTLRDGEQKVLLSGQASVGIQFSQIGEERFLTLRIDSSEGSENHAILGTGGRFRFRNAGAEYYVSVLRLDQTERTAGLRVDRVLND